MAIVIPQTNFLVLNGGQVYALADQEAYGFMYGRSKADNHAEIARNIGYLRHLGYSDEAIVDYLVDLSERMVTTKFGGAIQVGNKAGKIVISGVSY